MTSKSLQYLPFAIALCGLVGLALTGGPAIVDTAIGSVTGDAAQSANTTDEPGAGAQLSGVVAVQDETVRGEVERESRRVALESTESPEARATLLDQRLADTENRVTTLERRADAVEQDRENGRTNEYTAQAAEIGQAARSLEQLLDQTATAIEELPADVREQRELTAQLESLQGRLATVQNQTSDATRTIEGADTEIRASPLTFADLEEAMTETAQAGSGADRLFSSERIDLHVRTANGTTLRAGVRTKGGEVVSVQQGSIDDPTVRVYTNYQVARDLQRSDDAASVIRDAIENDRIIVDGVGLGNSVRYGVASILEWLS